MDERTLLLRFAAPSPLPGQALYDPYPRHLLGAAFANPDRDAFVNHEFWTTGYVAAGPYRLSGWAPGAFQDYAAFADYVEGAPRIDAITVRFLGDPNTLLANVLADHLAKPALGRLPELIVTFGFLADHQLAAAIAGVKPFVARNAVAGLAVEPHPRPHFHERTTLGKTGRLFELHSHPGGAHIVFQNPHRADRDAPEPVRACSRPRARHCPSGSSE